MAPRVSPGERAAWDALAERARAASTVSLGEPVGAQVRASAPGSGRGAAGGPGSNPALAPPESERTMSGSAPSEAGPPRADEPEAAPAPGSAARAPEPPGVPGERPPEARGALGRARWWPLEYDALLRSYFEAAARPSDPTSR